MRHGADASPIIELSRNSMVVEIDADAQTVAILEMPAALTQAGVRKNITTINGLSAYQQIVDAAARGESPIRIGEPMEFVFDDGLTLSLIFGEDDEPADSQAASVEFDESAEQSVSERAELLPTEPTFVDLVETVTPIRAETTTATREGPGPLPPVHVSLEHNRPASRNPDAPQGANTFFHSLTVRNDAVLDILREQRERRSVSYRAIPLDWDPYSDAER